MPCVLSRLGGVSMIYDNPNGAVANACRLIRLAHPRTIQLKSTINPTPMSRPNRRISAPGLRWRSYTRKLDSRAVLQHRCFQFQRPSAPDGFGNCRFGGSCKVQESCRYGLYKRFQIT